MSDTMKRHIRYRLIQPFQRDRRFDFAAAGGEKLVRSKVKQVLGT